MPDEAKTVRKSRGSLISSLIRRPDELNILHLTDVSDIWETVKLQSFRVKQNLMISSDPTSENTWFHFLSSCRL